MHRLLKRGLPFAAVGLVLITTAMTIVRDDEPGLRLLPFDAKRGGLAFTGVALSFHSPLVPHRVRFFLRGKQGGTEIVWAADGRRIAERRFRKGREHGLQRGWFPDGQPRYQKEFTDGEANGEFWAWHANGKPALFARYERGRELIYRTWSWNGKPFYNYLWRDGARVGVLGDTFCDRRKPLPP